MKSRNPSVVVNTIIVLIGLGIIIQSRVMSSEVASVLIIVLIVVSIFERVGAKKWSKDSTSVISKNTLRLQAKTAWTILLDFAKYREMLTHQKSAEFKAIHQEMNRIENAIYNARSRLDALMDQLAIEKQNEK